MFHIVTHNDKVSKVLMVLKLFFRLYMTPSVPGKLVQAGSSKRQFSAQLGVCTCSSCQYASSLEETARIVSVRCRNWWEDVIQPYGCEVVWLQSPLHQCQMHCRYYTCLVVRNYPTHCGPKKSAGMGFGPAPLSKTHTIWCSSNKFIPASSETL